MSSTPIELGSRYGRLTVIRRDGGRRYVCLCDCGEDIRVLACHLRNGHIKSCGCSTGGLKHGKCRVHYKSPEYNSYSWARQACRTRGSKYFPRFGGRGIQFEFDNFVDFYNYVGNRPGSDYRLERIDPDGNFEKGNLQWIPRRRRTRVRK